MLSFTAFLRHSSEQGTLVLSLSLHAPHCCPLALGNVCVARGVLAGQIFLQAPVFGQMLCVFGQKGLYLDACEKEQWRAPPSEKSTVSVWWSKYVQRTLPLPCSDSPERRKGFIFPSKREFGAKS